MKNVCILGSTGSIGRNSLEVIANFPANFRVTYLTANRNIDLLQQQIRREGFAGGAQRAANPQRRRQPGFQMQIAGPIRGRQTD